MGTRAIVLVHGGHTYCKPTGPQDVQSVRLYSHDGGDPTDMLSVLHKAILAAEEYIDRQRDWITPVACNGKRAGVDRMPAHAFADYVTAASLGRYGAGVVLDDGDGAEARFRGEVLPEHWGRQGDLEWMYLVHQPSKTVTVYGGDYGDPDEHLARGPVDPAVVCLGFLEQYRGKHYLGVLAALANLRRAGWTVTPPRGTWHDTFFVRRKWGSDLTRKALAWLDSTITAEHRTGSVLALLARCKTEQTLDKLPVLADVLEDAGLTDPWILKVCRNIAA